MAGDKLGEGCFVPRAPWKPRTGRQQSPSLIRRTRSACNQPLRGGREGIVDVKSMSEIVPAALPAHPCCDGKRDRVGLVAVVEKIRCAGDKPLRDLLGT